MPNPSKPTESKRLIGNPGKRALPEAGLVAVIEGGYREPLRELGVAGQTLWYDVWGHGISWVSPRSDVHLLQVVCELFDRRELLREAFLIDPTERKVNMSLLETEKLIQSSLSLLGFTPSDRARLGLAEVKKESRLDEMLARRAARDDG